VDPKCYSTFGNSGRFFTWNDKPLGSYSVTDQRGAVDRFHNSRPVQLDVHDEWWAIISAASFGAISNTEEWCIRPIRQIPTRVTASESVARVLWAAVQESSAPSADTGLRRPDLVIGRAIVYGSHRHASIPPAALNKRTGFDQTQHLEYNV